MHGLLVEYHYSNSYINYVCSSPTDNAASPVSETTTDSDEETMVVVTTNRDYYITREKFVKPVQETSQSASVELVLST